MERSIGAEACMVRGRDKEAGWLQVAWRDVWFCMTEGFGLSVAALMVVVPYDVSHTRQPEIVGHTQ